MTNCLKHKPCQTPDGACACIQCPIRETARCLCGGDDCPGAMSETCPGFTECPATEVNREKVN